MMGYTLDQGSRMKRKEYRSISERKADNRAGFRSFPVVNLVLWVVYKLLQTWDTTNYSNGSGDDLFIQILILMLPWVVNGLILVWNFVFRPEFAIGYLVFIAFALVVVFALGILFFGSCILAVGVGFIFVASETLFNFVAFTVLLIAFIAGAVKIGEHAKNWYEEWLAVPIENKWGGEFGGKIVESNDSDET
jgi:hypothetical protein